MHSASALGKLDVSQKSYDVKEQIENHLTGKLMNKGNFEFQYLYMYTCTGFILVHFDSLLCKLIIHLLNFNSKRTCFSH